MSSSVKKSLNKSENVLKRKRKNGVTPRGNDYIAATPLGHIRAKDLENSYDRKICRMLDI